jgi:hypothetical protein
MGRFVTGTFRDQGHFVMGCFVMGRFVMGRFVCESSFGPLKPQILVLQ